MSETDQVKISDKGGGELCSKFSKTVFYRNLTVIKSVCAKTKQQQGTYIEKGQGGT